MPPGSDTDVVNISAGMDTTCVVSVHAELECWGGKESGLLTNSNSRQAEVPEVLRVGVNSVEAGLGHWCVLKQNGKL